MAPLVAVQPDDYGPNDSSSARWIPFLQEGGCDVRIVDVYESDIIDRLRDCHGLMWRHGHNSADRQIARRLVPLVENTLGLSVYPDVRTCWTYDDKIAQHLVFQAIGTPTPLTKVFFKRSEAEAWVEQAIYPLVFKLWSGAGSSNVMLIESVLEAKRMIDQLFSRGLTSARENALTNTGERRPLWDRLRGQTQSTPSYPDGWDVHKGYVYVQEFVPNNDFDTRITVIGDRAFGFRRFNRPEDFRASGSGTIDWDPDQIDKRFIEMAFELAQKIGSQSCAVDGLLRNNEPVITEFSYTYASYAVEACPGHWGSDLSWNAGQMPPEKAQVEDFLQRLKMIRR